MTDTAVHDYPASGPIGLQPPRRRRPAWQRWLSVAGVGGLLMAGGVVTSLYSPFPVQEVEIIGASLGIEPQISGAVGASVGQSFASIDRSEIAARITAIEGIDDVRLRWGWWGKLVITVAEQLPAAILAAPSGGYSVIDTEGQPIRMTVERPPGLVLVEAPSEHMGVALEVAGALNPELLGVTDAVVIAPDGASATLRLTSGAQVLLGAPTDLERKFAVAAQLLPLGGSSINVAVPERPAIAGLPEAAPST